MNNLAVPGDWPSTCDFAAVERLASRTGGAWTTGRYQRYDLQTRTVPTGPPLQSARRRERRQLDWSRRPYFRRALEHPGRVQVSRPYLSLAGARPCVTLSMSLRVNGVVRVLCGDVTCAASAIRRGRSPATTRRRSRTMSGASCTTSSASSRSSW